MSGSNTNEPQTISTQKDSSLTQKINSKNLIIHDKWDKAVENNEPLDFMGKFQRLWADQESSALDFELLEKSNPDYKLPEYVNGEFFNSGPSKWSMGDRKYQHALDGFGRISKWDVQDGEVKFTSNLLDCNWLNECKKVNDLIPGISFRTPSP